MEKYTYYEINKFQAKINNNNNSISHIISSNNKSKSKADEDDIRKISEKIKEERKINKILKSENEKLFKDIITIKINIKSLIPTMSQNKKFPFPSMEILIEEIKSYISIDSVKYSADGNRIVFENISQDMFLKIPGSPLAYWLSDNVINCFNHKTIKEVSISDGQTKTGDNNRYLRFLWEISANDLGINQKWVKHPKGGAYRRWYGNIEWVVDWSPEARAFYRADRVARILPEYLWWKKGISWTLLTSGMQGYRDYQDDCIFNLAAPTLFFNNEEDRLYILGLLNTPLSVLLISIFNPTINNNIGDIQSIPLIKNNVDDIIVKVKDNIEISKSDWDSHETSWDFEANPLVALRNEKVAQGNLESSFRLSDFVEEFEAQWTERFMQLHQNEEELNRQFISIYGLQDELTPDVPLDEITILQQGEISIKREQSPSSLETMPSDEDIQQSQISIIDN